MVRVSVQFIFCWSTFLRIALFSASASTRALGINEMHHNTQHQAFYELQPLFLLTSCSTLSLSCAVTNLCRSLVNSCSTRAHWILTLSWWTTTHLAYIL